jgi:hypothetical protein
MKIIITIALGLILTGCGTKTILVMPDVPETLMTPPRTFKAPVDGSDLKTFAEVVVVNNNNAVQNSIQLESLQTWILEMKKIYKK